VLTGIPVGYDLLAKSKLKESFEARENGAVLLSEMLVLVDPKTGRRYFAEGFGAESRNEDVWLTLSQRGR